MAKFVTFDDGLGTYNFRGIFPSSATRRQILKSVERKVKSHLRERRLDNEDFDFDDIPEFTTITSMREGIFYEPGFGGWND